MPILNYTTQISVDKTVMEIQAKLAKVGAKSVLTDYDDEGNLKSIAFKLVVEGNVIGFRLPAEPEKIYALLKCERGVAHKYQNMGQARRVAWRIIKDWVEAQVAIIETRMVKPEQVFLPYAITNDNTTLYESIVRNGMLLKPGGEE